MTTKVSPFMGGLGIDARNKFEVLANATVTIGGSATGNVNIGNFTVKGSGSLLLENGAFVFDRGSSTDPIIHLSGVGPNTIRFHDGQDETNATNAVDIAYRTSPNDLRIERAENDNIIAEFGGDDGHAALYHNDSKKLETTSGGIEVTGTITIGSAGISEAELEILDGATVTTDELNKLDGVTATTAELNTVDVTAGTVTASKAVVVDANKDIGSFRNVTATGDISLQNGTSSLLKFLSADGSSQGYQIKANISDSADFGLLIEDKDNNDIAKFLDGGEVLLTHNHLTRFQTTATGVSITGNVNATSNVILGGNVVATGDVVAAHYHGDGGLLSNVATATANPATSLASDTDFGTLTSANTTAATDAFTVVISDAIDAFDLLTEPARAQETLNLGAF